MNGFKLDWGDEELTAEVQRSCKKAVLAGARDIAIDAKMRVPVDTGELLFSIEVKLWEKPDTIGAYVKAGGDDRGHIARFVELGTPGAAYRSGKKKGEYRKPVKAKPYLRPALKKNKAKILTKFKDILK
jgi:HK97 gp10 family phage protein